MSEKELKNVKAKSELIMCKNCHQDILKEKMFLHEGFCLRNNVFCEQCEKVFLKKDFDDHFKNLHKNDNNDKNDSLPQEQKSSNKKSESRKQNTTTEHNDSINNLEENNETNPSPSLEFIQMPVTELFHINNPIIISENGQIVSNKNKNEFLLPYLGINLFENNKKSEEILDGLISQGDIFKENNTFSRNSYKLEDLQKLFNKENITSYNRANTNVYRNYRESDYSNTFRENINPLLNSGNKNTNNKFNNNNNTNNNSNNNKYNNNINYYKSKSFIDNINYNYNYTDSNINCNSPVNLTYNNNISYGKKQKNNNIIFNNHIMHNTNNSNKNIKKMYSFDPDKENQQKPPLINSLEKNNNTFESIPLNNHSIKSHQFQINNSNSISGNKEPKDSNSKTSRFYQSSGQKIKVNINKPFKANSAKGKNNMIKRCEFCNNIFNIGDFNIHYNNCKNKFEQKKIVRKFDIPKPIKKEKKMIKEKFNTESNEENRIEEKKEYKEFNAALNEISLNNHKKKFNGMMSNPERKVKIKKIIKEPKKHNLKNKLFHLNDVNFDKGDFPEDSIKIEVKEKNPQKKNIKRINNMSVDGNNIDINNNFGNYIKIIKSPVSTNISNEEIDPWLYFYNNNNKKNNEQLELLKGEKNKKIIINTFQTYEE